MATPIVGFVAYKQHNGDEVDDSMVDEMSCCVASWSCEAIRDGVRHFMQHRGLVHSHINVVMGPVSATRGMMIFIITVGKDDDDDDDGGATTTRHSLLPAYLHAENEKRCLPIMWQKKPPSSASIAKTSATTSSSCVGRHVLLIGAGGIGCEVLKVLLLDSLQRWRRGDAKHVAGNIVIVDLDDIDATNLNRQFLFTTADIGKSKAETARTSVMRWFHDRTSSSSSSHDDVSQYVPNIVAHHGNIKAPHFDESFFGRFHIIINALDNVSARQHVNRMCSAVSVPLVESGTMGYNGQVQPILRGALECYDCRPTPPDTQTYAVCTIHARPTTMVHCVHFAKELFNALFAGGDDGDDEEEVGPSSPSLDDAAAASNSNNNTEQVGELTYMRARLRAWRVEQKQRCINNNDNNNDHDELRNLILFGVEVLRHIGVDKINAILAMKSSWGDDGPPVPLSEHVLSSVAAHIEQRWMRMYANGELCLDELPMEGPPSRDEPLHLRVAVALFISAMARAVRRSHHHHQHTSFSKDDDVAVDLIAATASLRACNYHIFRPPTTQDGEALSSYSVEDLRTIAGAIVPAIATTNAIIAAAAVQQMHHLMLLAEHNTQQHSEKNCDVGKARMVYVRRQPLQQRRWPPVHSCWLHGTSSSSSSSCRRKRERGGNHLAPITDHLMLHSVLPNLPSPSCHVCQRVPPPHITILCTTTTTTTTTTTLSTWCLADFVRACLVEELEMEAPSVMCGAQLIFEEEAFEALGDEPLAHFIANGDVLHLSVDALNHEVGWVVSVRNASTNDDEEQRCSSRAFSIVGLEEAKKAEAAAVAQQQAAPAHEKDGTVDDDDEDAHGVVEIDSDDDEVVEVSQ